MKIKVITENEIFILKGFLHLVKGQELHFSPYGRYGWFFLFDEIEGKYYRDIFIDRKSTEKKKDYIMEVLVENKKLDI